MAEQTIIVMSDSHGERDIVVDIKKRYQGKVDAIFHNGDSELESSDSVWEGIHVVRGNCDYDSGYPERLVVKLGDVILRKRMVISLGLILPGTSWIFGHNKRMLISVYMGIYMWQQLGEMVRQCISIQVLFHSHVAQSMRNSMLR